VKIWVGNTVEGEGGRGTGGRRGRGKEKEGERDKLTVEFPRVPLYILE